MAVVEGLTKLTCSYIVLSSSFFNIVSIAAEAIRICIPRGQHFRNRLFITRIDVGDTH